MTPAQILKPYQIFDPAPAVEGVEEPPVHDEIQRDVIMLNGPPGCGKTHLVDYLKKRFGPKLGVVVPSSALYSMMRVCGLPETHLEYGEFKRIPYGRERLIAASTVFRKYNADIFSIQTLTSETWLTKPLIVVDNTGFEDEILFYSRYAKRKLLIEIIYPHGHETLGKTLIDAYDKAHRGATQWPGDSRFGLVSNKTLPLKSHEAAAFISSEWAMRGIDRFVFNGEGHHPDKFLARLRPTAFGTLHEMAKDHWMQPPVMQDLFDCKE